MNFLEYTTTINRITPPISSQNQKGSVNSMMINALASALKINIDGIAFNYFNHLNKTDIESFARRLNLLKIAESNIALWLYYCGEFPIDEFIFNKKPLTKIDWALLVYISLSNPVLFEKIKSNFEDITIKVWEQLVWTRELNEAQTNELIGKSPIIRNNNQNTWGQTNKNESPITELEMLAHKVHTYPNTSWTFSLPEVIRVVQKKFVTKPKLYDFIASPLPEGLSIFETEKLIFTDIMHVIGYATQGNIKTTNSGKPNMSSIGKMRKVLNIKEFYEKNEDLENLRSHCLANWVVLLDKTKLTINTPPLDLLYTLVGDIYKTGLTSFCEATCNHLKGFKKINPTLTEASFYTNLAQLPLGEWVLSSNIEKYFHYRDIIIAPLSAQNSRNYLEYDGISEYTGIKTGVLVADYKHYDMVAKAHLYGSIFMLASLGIFDLAYTTPNTNKLGTTYFSDWDGLKAVRLTTLGAYLLGKSKTYTAPETQENTQLVFDEQSLIILGKADDALTDTLLLNYVQKAGSNRYLVTPQSFLKGCNDASEIAAKIKLFRQTVGKKTLPANWEFFFEKLLSRTKNINRLEEYEVFQLQADDKELIKLIAQDKQLQHLTIKAEGFKVLVLKKELPTFKNKLRDWGYLLS